MRSSLTSRHRHRPRILLPTVGEGVLEETLWAGDIFASRGRIRMTTVLGSCVSVCLFDTHLTFGGMNHYLLPTPGADGRHGEWSIRELHQRMLNLGSKPRHLQAKVFGGGSPLALANEASAVGNENARVALEVLASLRVPIASECVGGNNGMRIYFENWTGLVLVRPHREGGTTI
ncbi:MAG: chemotaxis protein CheD [Nibricoccus sp.]